MKSRPARRVAVLPALAVAAAVALSTLSACSAGGAHDAGDARYATDYANHQPLAVVGYPSTGSLGITQQVVWRIADGKADALAGLADRKGDAAGKGVPEKTAENWIKAFGKGAAGKVTAEFYDEGSVRQEVVLYFHDTGQIKQIQVLATNANGKDAWKVTMAEPDPGEAVAVSPWVPKTPGELGSKTVR
ncbi:hypothetical protein ABZ128_12015 [Streptomyces sp. NPDC006326]|uniref:hypothetical protein n=1 Tax=Streptomyces sp. NPDC006326 TaxID=3156752 RepID=UPI0033B69D1F